MPDALVLANRDDADPGLVGDALRDRGYCLTTIARDDGEGAPGPGRRLAPADADLVLVLGSEWSVYEETVRSAVERECSLVAAAVAAGTPVLAICFGAQLLARALGGDVLPAACTELGWLEVEPVDGASTSIAPGPWFQFHHDTFTVPAGATLLARSEVGPQAYRIGSALGVQFHPEVTPEIVRRWATSDPEPVARAGFTVDELVERTTAEQPRVRQATRALVDTFLSDPP